MTSTETLPPKSEILTRWLPLLAFCAVLAHNFWYVNGNAINIPHQDDIYDFVQFVSVVENTGSTSERFKVLFSQYNDHRTSATRALVYGIYLVEGELNFHTLTLVANLGLWLILFLFYLTVRKEKYRWVYLLISSLLLLHLRYVEITLFSQGAFAYYYVCVYAFACILMLHRVSGPKFLLAAVFCTLSSLTLASGQIAWLLGFVTLSHQCLVNRRSLMWPMVWLLTAAVMLMLWHSGFTDVPHKITSDMLAKHDESIELSNSVGWGKSAIIDPDYMQTLTRYAAFFLVLLGSGLVYFSEFSAGVFGFIVLAALLFVTLKFSKHDDIRLALFCWFLVGFSAAVTVGRSLIAGPEYILSSRYTFISALLLCTLVLLLQVRFASKRPALLLLLIPAVMYWSYFNFYFEARSERYMQGRYLEFNRGRFPVILMPAGESEKIVNEAISAGIYNPPCRPLPKCENRHLPRGE